MPQSKEYEEGFLSRKYENPYDAGTTEYDDFERGWVQRLKRNLPIDESGKIESYSCDLDLAFIKKKSSQIFEKKKNFTELLAVYGIEKK